MPRRRQKIIYLNDYRLLLNWTIIWKKSNERGIVKLTIYSLLIENGMWLSISVWAFCEKSSTVFDSACQSLTLYMQKHVLVLMR